MEQLTANILGKTRREKLNGREHIVAPLSLIVPGVLNGSQGPLYYPQEEINKNPSAWNHIPIVLGHPALNGSHVSARDPDILNATGIGVVMRAEANGKLIAEGWFDVETTRRIDNRILQSLEEGKPIELSTGLFTKNEPAEDGATFNGTSYSATARNYQPDHLAILPDTTGACSVDDGCGVLVNKNEPTINSTLFGLTSRNKGHIHTVRVDDDGFGGTDFEDGHSHSVRGFKVRSANGHTHSVEKDKLTEINTNNEEGNMPLNEKEKGAIVDSLVANCDCWNKEDEGVLNSFSDEKLEILNKGMQTAEKHKNIVNSAWNEFVDAGGNTHTYNEKTTSWDTKMKEKKEEPVLNEKKDKPKTAEEWMAEAPAEIRNVVENSMKKEEEDRLKLFTTLTENSTDEEWKKYLGSKSSTELGMLQRNLPEAKEEAPAVNYLGASVPTGNVAPEEMEVLPLPFTDYSKQA